MPWNTRNPTGVSRNLADLNCVYAVQDLAAGYTSGKLLLKLDFTSYILQHHTAEHFAFLDDPANSRSRTTFYFTLARLLFVEDTAAKFKAFVRATAAGKAPALLVPLIANLKRLALSLAPLLMLVVA